MGQLVLLLLAFIPSALRAQQMAITFDDLPASGPRPAVVSRLQIALLDMYRAHGFTFVSLPEAERDPLYAEDPDFGYPGGGALTEQLTAKRGLKFPPNAKPYQELEAACR